MWRGRVEWVRFRNRKTVFGSNHHCHRLLLVLPGATWERAPTTEWAPPKTCLTAAPKRSPNRIPFGTPPSQGAWRTSFFTISGA